MKREQILITVIESDEGMTLTNGETYSKCVYLGVHDSPENWHEVSDEQVPQEGDIVE